MTGPDESDRAAVDRAFAEMVAGYHLTADRPGSTPVRSDVEPSTWSDPYASLDPWPGADHPAVASRPAELGPPVAPTSPVSPSVEPVAAAVEPAEASEPGWTPEPPLPVGHVAAPVLFGWLGMGWAVLVVLAVAFGAPLPTWVGWVALIGFLGGFALLVSRLPRHRPPGSGDGAVL